MSRVSLLFRWWTYGHDRGLKIILLDSVCQHRYFPRAYNGIQCLNAVEQVSHPRPFAWLVVGNMLRCPGQIVACLAMP